MYESIEIFKDIKEKDIESLLTCLSAFKKSYYKNEYVIVAGDETDDIGILLSGELHVIKEDIYGNKAILTNIKDYEMFGEAFVCAQTKFLPVSVVATKNSEILFISLSKLLVTCNNSCVFHNKLIFNLVSILARKNIVLNKKIDYLTAKTTKEKIAKYIINLMKSKDQKTVILPFNRNDLAEFLGVNRSVLSRELSALKKEGIFDFNKNKLTILNHEKLSRLSQ